MRSRGVLSLVSRSRPGAPSSFGAADAPTVAEARSWSKVRRFMHRNPIRCERAHENPACRSSSDGRGFKGDAELREDYAALTIFPVLMQLVQTRRRLEAPLTRALTAWRLTFQRRRLTLCACEMLLPNCGPLPQISQICAMVKLQIFQGLSTPPEQLAHTPNPASSPCRIFSIPVRGPSRPRPRRS